MTGTGRSADRPGIVPVPPPEERAPVAGRLRFGRIEGIGQPIVRLVLGGGGLGSGALVGDRAMELLDDFVARGGNCLDTAHVYGDGASEAVIGRWLTRRGGCREVVVVTKGAHPPATTPAAVRPQLAESLERLGCDQVDLYLLHRDDPEVPVAEFVDALDEVRTLGWTQAVGVSNWSLERLVAAREDAVRRGRTKPVALSNHVSLAELTRPPFDGGQGVRVSDLGRLADSRVAVLSWSARAHGYFARRGASLGAAGPWEGSENAARRARAEELAARRGTTADLVALAWLLAVSPTTFPIVGSRTPEETAELFSALEFDMDAAEVAFLWDGAGLGAGAGPSLSASPSPGAGRPPAEQ